MDRQKAIKKLKEAKPLTDRDGKPSGYVYLIERDFDEALAALSSEPKIFSGMSFAKVQTEADRMLSVGGHSGYETNSRIDNVLILIANLAARMREKSEPVEPSEFTEMLRTIIKDSKSRPVAPVEQSLQLIASKAADTIDRQTARIEQLEEQEIKPNPTGIGQQL